MATSRSQNQAAVVGYECEFLDQVPEEYICRQCKHVAREPIIVDCCNETMCEACVQEMMEDNKPCSNCQKIPVKYIPNKIKNKILDLNVRCSMAAERSCKWTGQLQQLDEHLSDCEYVDTKCDQCQKSIQKRNNFMTTHLANECPEREFSCKYCNYKATYVLVTEVHFKNCKLYILNCPNGCGVHFERGELEDHINMCSLQKVECEFSYAGCEDKFIRGQQKDHMEQNTQKHLVLMSTATLRISQEQQQANKQKLQEQEQAFDQKLQEQKQAFEQNLQEQKQAFEQRTNRLKKKLTSATRSLMSEYILLISLSVLIIACAIYYEQGVGNLPVENDQTLKKDTEKSIKAMKSETENDINALKKDTEKSIKAMKSETENDINALKMETDERMEVMKSKTDKTDEITKKINVMQREHEKKINALNALIIQNNKINIPLAPVKTKKFNDDERKKTGFVVVDWTMYLIIILILLMFMASKLLVMLCG